MYRKNHNHSNSLKSNRQAAVPQTGADLDALLADLFCGAEDGMAALTPTTLQFLEEHLCDPHPDCGQEGTLIVNEEKKKRRERRIDGGRGVRREGPDVDPTLSTPLNSPITNRGASKYQGPEATTSPPRQLGGYDGGIEVGFEGLWNPSNFTDLLQQLEGAKQKASEQSKSCEAHIGGQAVLVEPTGANIGLHYKYVFVLGGVRFFVHHNPPKGRQGVRIRYTAAALIGRSLFSLHNLTLAFLRELGFIARKETISRVDMQVLVECEAEDLIDPITRNNQGVCKARRDQLHRKNGKVQTYTVGQAGGIELCIYNKKDELLKAMTGDPVKAKLTIEHCLGEDWFFDNNRPITRVEFRLWREVLLAMDIHTVQDLQEREAALADWLTDKWFRLLEKPKVRGHENTAELHPLWINVQRLFRLCFPGVGVENKPVEWRRTESVSCDSTPLVKQAVGCLAKAVALECGDTRNDFGAFVAARDMLRKYKEVLYSKVSDTVRRVKIGVGVVLGGEAVPARAGGHWPEYDDLDVQSACATIIDTRRWF